MLRRSVGYLAITTVGAFAAMTIATPAAAATASPSNFSLGFARRTPGEMTAMTLRITYRQPGQPNAKPPAIRHLVIDAPRGTVFHTSTVPACQASNAELMALGARGCPSDTQVGSGPVTVITGFGPPVDPFTVTTPTFNDGVGWVEASEIPTGPTSVTAAVTRLSITGNRLVESVGAVPGGPPDGRSAVRTVDLVFPVSTGYITTPPTCPASGRWVTTATFQFYDGTTQHARSSTPCMPVAGSAGHAHHATGSSRPTPSGSPAAGQSTNSSRAAVRDAGALAATGMPSSLATVATGLLVLGLSVLRIRQRGNRQRRASPELLDGGGAGGLRASRQGDGRGRHHRTG